MANEENKIYQLNELNQSTTYTLLNLVSVLDLKVYEYYIQEYLNRPNNTRATQVTNRHNRRKDVYQ